MPREIPMPDYLKEDAEAIHNRMLARAPKDINIVEGDIFWDNTRPYAEEKAELTQIKLQGILKQAFPQTATGVYLEYHGEEKGVFKHPATHSTGYVTITGTSGTMIPKGHMAGTISTDDNPSIEFTVLEDTIIDVSETAQVRLECTEPGIKGNVAKGTIEILTKSINGVRSITNEEDFHGGTEIEDEESFRERVLEAYRNEPLSGAPRDYKRWAREVPGVGNVYVIPEWNGPGSVKVLVMDSNGSPASEDLLIEVRKHIIDRETNGKNTSDGLSPIGALVTAMTPELVGIDISATINFDTNFERDQVIEEIENQINNYFSSIDINGTVTYKAIEGLLGSMIIRKEGIVDYSNLLMNGSTENIELDHEVPYLVEVIIE